MNFQDLNEKIDRLRFDTNSALNHETSWKEVWGLVKEIGNDFKSVRFPSGNEHQAAWNKFQEQVQFLKTTQEKNKQRQVDEQERLEKLTRTKLETLSEMVREAETDYRVWKKVWDSIKEINEECFSHRGWMDLGIKNQYRNAFNEVVGNVKSIQNAQRIEWNRKREHSGYLTGEILSLAEKARPGDDFLTGMVEGFFTLMEGYVKSLLPFAEFKSESDRKWEDLKFFSAHLGEARAAFSRSKGQILPQDRQRIFCVFDEVQGELDQAWQALKNQKDEYYQARREEAEAKREAWREKTQASIENLEERCSRLQEALSRKEERLEDLNEQYENARSDSFQEVVQGWITEEESRIEDIKAKIGQIEGWIDELREKLY